MSTHTDDDKNNLDLRVGDHDSSLEANAQTGNALPPGRQIGPNQSNFRLSQKRCPRLRMAAAH